MNFFKWLIDILLGWIMYIPKKIWNQMSGMYSRNVMPNGLSWREIKVFLNEPQKSESRNINNLGFNNLELVVLFIFFLILSLVISEESVTRSVLSQSFIGFMSFLLPGIEMMSHDSDMPQIASLELSVAFVMIPFMVLLFFYRFRKIKECSKETFTSQFTSIYVFNILLSIFVIYVSLQKEPVFIFFDPYTKSRFAGYIAQTKIGLGILIWSGTWFVPELFGKTILVSWKIVKTLIKRIQKNER
ncbi:MAG: hypothetical protein PHQ22_10640 [Sulfuricurvum sp.]|nr:hypothetical protein [Sulfuricurvum sp.]